MLIPMVVFGVAMDSATKMPFLILKDKDEKYSLPIWIGLFEASAIANIVDKVIHSRPMTHDLLKNVIELLGSKMLRVEIHDIQINTYHARIILLKEGEEVVADARPSDAIALALRTQVPIFVDKVILEGSKADQVPMIKTFSLNEEPDWGDILANLAPEDFGKYKM